jgi:aspartyl-tRNA(Asn)/glutamyl-tRNA(Gln) amidotransferase subunit A
VRIPLAIHAGSMGVSIMGAEGGALHRDMSRAQRELAGADVRVSLAAARATSSSAHLDAERFRAQLRREVAAAFTRCDVLALPVLPGRAPVHGGEALASDVALLQWMCRHAFLATLTGVPALSAPIGLDVDQVPLGLQLVGDAWDEAGLLAVAAHLERTEIAVPRVPPGALDLLA